MPIVTPMYQWEGGVFWGLGLRLKASTTDRGIIPSQCTIWVHIDHPPLGNIGILEIYALNGKCERVVVWHKLAYLMDNKRDWRYEYGREVHQL